MLWVRRIVLPLFALALVLVAGYAINVWLGMRATAQTSGTIAGLGLSAPVQILRDSRGVPHIRAQNERDLFFADGFVEAQDRGFQLDLLRRYVYGRLSEVLGPSLLAADEHARQVPVLQLVKRQYAALSPRDRMLLDAFAAGVNAAYARESTPVEFRALMYRPQTWQPYDSLAVGFATVLDLTDTWDDIARRIGKATPLTDPCYDAPVTAGLARINDGTHCTASRVALYEFLRSLHPAKGSNAWAAGAAHTTDHRALLASDPHLRLQIPGVWYLVDLQAPGYHVAGATLAGTPGVILGHNDDLAWGVTNGTVTALSVFYPPKHLDPRYWQTERFHVRFGGTVTKRYYRAPEAFGVTLTVQGRKRFALVRWDAYAHPQSPIATFDQLARSHTMQQALLALRRYPGPTQNFVLADRTGRVAYQLAGKIPDDPLWGRNIHPASDLAETYADIPFDRLPHVAPSRNAIVWTANNKMYGAGYPYRLSADFKAPYRAYRIAQMLRAKPAYDVAYFEAMQMDTLSLPERELSRHFRQFAGWNGRFTPQSRRATAIYDVREHLTKHDDGDTMDVVMGTRAHDISLASVDPPASPQPWGVAGAVVVKHPLAALGFSFLNGTTLPGDGDAFTVHRQNYGFSQSYRAVWDAGNWDAGGMIVPQGESGRPGSGHYTDQAADWVSGTMIPLPYSNAAVDRATVDRLTLTP